MPISLIMLNKMRQDGMHGYSKVPYCTRLLSLRGLRRVRCTPPNVSMDINKM